MIRILMTVAFGCLAVPALAQGSFGGSFGDASGAGDAQPQPTTGGGSFGGSFGDAGAGTGPGPTPSAPAAGGDDFGGSFGGGGGAVSGGGGAAPGGGATGGGAAADMPGGSDFGGSFGGGSGDGGTGQGVQPPPGPNPNPPPGPDTGPQIDPQIGAFETRDFGVPPTRNLRQGQFHAPTPTSLPGAQVVSTQGLATALQQGMKVVVIDVLGGNYSLPDAFVAPGLAEPGTLNDRIQQQAAQWLGQITGGAKDAPIAIYCSDPMCWLSYNAALRTVAAGYTNVYWYRGGIQAWQMAGLRVQPSSF